MNMRAAALRSLSRRTPGGRDFECAAIVMPL
jgi:hypothetical protein